MHIYIQDMNMKEMNIEKDPHLFIALIKNQKNLLTMKEIRN